MNSAIALRVVVSPWASSRARPLIAGLGRELAGAVEAEEADVGQLAVPFIGAVRLAQLLVAAGHVEDVIDDLEEDPELGGEAAQARLLPLGRRGQDERRADARGDQTARLQRMQQAQGLGVRVPFTGDVDVLTTDHAVHPGRGRDLPDRGENAARLPLLALRDQPDRLSEERVAARRDVLPGGTF